ncbi:MAG: MFS transporter [Lachnospiraceae bacterium]|nr:MFS transporter [Lachnospiraceae bacterium]
MRSFFSKHYHWVIVAVCCGFSGVAAGLAVNCMGVFYLPVSKELGVGVGDISFYLTIMNIVQGLLSAVVVRVMKRVPLRLMLAIAAAVGTGCYLLMSLGTSVWHFYLVAVLLGAANAFTGMIVGNVVIANWFDKKMGTATAIFMALAGVIGAVLSPVFAALIESIGWRSVYRIAAAIEVILLLPAILLVRLTPGELGMKKYGEGEAPGPEKKIRIIALPEERKFGLRSLGTVMLYLIACLVSFAATISQHLSSYASSIGKSPAFGAALISASMIGNIVTKLAAGVIGDRLGSVRATVILLLTAGSGCLVLGLMSGSADIVLYTAAFATGGFYAVTGVSNLSMVKERFRAAEFARIVAYMNIARMVPQAVSHSAIGYSFDIFGSYRPAMLLCVGIAAAGIAASLLIARLKAGDK